MPYSSNIPQAKSLMDSSFISRVFNLLWNEFCPFSGTISLSTSSFEYQEYQKHWLQMGSIFEEEIRFLLNIYRFSFQNLNYLLSHFQFKLNHYCLKYKHVRNLPFPPLEDNVLISFGQIKHTTSKTGILGTRINSHHKLLIYTVF